MNTKAEVIRPEELAQYRDDKMGKVTLFESPRLMAGLNCFEPGQEHKLHAHAGMDKVYQVLAGEGLFLLDGEERAISAGMFLTAPADAPHGLRNTGNTRLLVLTILAPAPQK